LLLPAAEIFSSVCIGQAAPPPTASVQKAPGIRNGLTAFHSDEIGFTLLYPSVLEVQSAKSFKETVDRGHRAYYGTDPATDPEHQESEKCIHLLLSATLPTSETPAGTDAAVASIVLIETDRSCLKGSEDDILGNLASAPYQIPSATAVMPQTWWKVDKRKVHIGAATIEQDLTQGNAAKPLAVAASFVVKKHYLMVLLMSNSDAAEKLLATTQVQFGKDAPVLLLPPKEEMLRMKNAR
jgi:hypothetical protein